MPEQTPISALPGRVVSIAYGAINVLITDPSGMLTMKEMTDSAKDLMESVFKNLKDYEKTVIEINKSLPVMSGCSAHTAKAVPVEEAVEEPDSEETPHKEVDPAYGNVRSDPMVA